jgi:hypothetical protein
MADDDDENVVPLHETADEGDAPSEEQQEAWFMELVELKRTDRIKYERRKKEVAKLLGVTNLKVIDAQVNIVEKSLTANTGPDDDDDDPAVQELFDIGYTKSDLWHNFDGVEYATFERNGHLEHHKIEHRGYQNFLREEYGKLYQREVNGVLIPTYPKSKSLKEATAQLEAHAQIRGVERKPRARVNYVDGVLWLDLGRLDWRGVRITADGYKIVDKIDAPLIRGQGIRPLPEPVGGGDINDLQPFVNTRGEEEFALFCGSLAGLFNTFGNYTTTIFCGPAGSAKTTATRVMRGLVDPNKVATKPFSSVRDLRHGAGSTHIVALENISEIPDDFSDEICRLNTGLSFAERKYYNQGIEFQQDAHCPVLINGIPGNLAEREDLIDRSVTFRFDLLGDRLISDDAFWRAFEGARPRLLGVLLDGVVGALRVRQQVQGR